MEAPEFLRQIPAYFQDAIGRELKHLGTKQ